MPGYWHNKMELLFPEDMREVKFFCSSKDKNVCRRADILLNDRRTLEIQHSHISSNEIENRFNNWNKFGKEIIWLVDGNTEDVVCELLSSNNYLLIFNKVWKYKSFVKTYDFILLEVKNKVFKIELKKIKNKMIELREYKNLKDVIQILKTNPENIWSHWRDENVIKSKLVIHQLGAGNGKTYGIWRSISTNNDKKTYIIITKQHSAKNVIYEELIDQKQRKEYHIENLTCYNENNTQKHFVINYTHKKSNKNCKVIIGTIDSFCYNLAGSSSSTSDIFRDILKNVRENGANKVTQYGYMNFGGQSCILNRQTEIWIDEVQDLPKDYLFAMTRLMLDYSCDINVVGDKLQTLEYEDNFMTAITGEGLPNIAIIKNKARNINRRINTLGLYEEINCLVDFKSFSLPEISLPNEKKRDILNNKEKTIEIIESPEIYANDRDKEKLKNYIITILKKVEYEVDLNNYTPENFMFIFPIMKKNAIASELYVKLQEFWIKKFEDKKYITQIKNEYWKKYDHTKYTEYVFLHKHTEGVCINTQDSIKSTRIMSIRTSKGDGREVVFILNTTEQSLKKVSNKEFGLIYESHLHVALTRSKNKIYFGLTKNNDEIHRRFGESGYVDYLCDIKTTMPLERIIETIDKNEIIKLLLENGITQRKFIHEIDEKKSNKTKKSVDWGYHCIKYYSFFFRVILNVVENKFENSDYFKSGLYITLRKISSLRIERKNPKDFYEFIYKHQYNFNNPMTVFPVCILSKKLNYKKYSELIEESILKIQNFIKQDNLRLMNVYQSIIFVYMIQLYTSGNKAETTPGDIYNITHFFETKKNKEHELLNYLKNSDKIIEQSKIKNTKIHWDILKHIELTSKNDEFKISKLQFPILGNTENDVTHIILKNSLNKLNFWEVFIEIFLERFLIYNPHPGHEEKKNKNIEKYSDKKINTYLFILNENRYIKIEWCWDKLLKSKILDQIKLAIVSIYSENHSSVYDYLTDVIINKERWCDDVTPFKYISKYMKQKYKYPNYIINYFENSHEKWIQKKDKEVRETYKNKKIFVDTLNNKLTVSVDDYLGLLENSKFSSNF